MKPVEERIAAAICWLARQSANPAKPGLPDIPTLRYAVVNRHPFTCDWCDFPLDELLEMARVPEGDPSARAFAKYPLQQQRDMVAKAQGRSAA